LQSINAENKQGNITAEECNDIIKKLSLKTYEAEYKVLVMWMPEYLGKEGNKLLKLIEEPPPNTVFILVAENEEAILPTIVSRCQHINVPLPNKQALYNALINNYNANEIIANQMASLCEGNVREALQLLQHSNENWMPMVNDWLRILIRKMYADELKFIEDMGKLGREKQKQFLRYLNHLIEQSIKAAILPKEQIAITDEEYEFTQRLLKVGGVAQLQLLIKEIDDAIYYIERNANAKLLFQALGIKFYHILVNKQVVEIT
jgi:DNA polymerase-3 subunit delta'